MGIYLNPDSNRYERLCNSPIFVDKSLLIEYTNKAINTSNDCICVTRPRRFGKSTDANMLVAYYSKGTNSKDLFNTLNINHCPSFLEHLNKHNMIHLNIQEFLSTTNSIDEMLIKINRMILKDLKFEFKDVISESEIIDAFNEVYAYTKNKFIFIIDEWDCIFREFKEDKTAQETYLDFLRSLLKDKNYIEMCYMTGILPIKKYGTHSALNIFDEISMTQPKPLANYMGFTEEEVSNLYRKHNVDYQKMKDWYDGYHMTDTISTFSPRSVVSAISKHDFSNYWTKTKSFEALKIYINLNFDGLKDNIIQMMAGKEVYIDTSSFENDMSTFGSKDDVLTLLIHLGYLGYNQKDQTCYIPNKEVMDSFFTSIKNSDWNATTKAIQNSRNLLDATFNMDETKVADYIEQAHLETSHIQYNDENALSYTIDLAYYAARDHYTVIRELPTGKGFADLAFIPKTDKPAILVELKWNQDVNTAITQIKEKKYPSVLEKYKDNLLLVEITYDKKTRKHICKIERL